MKCVVLWTRMLGLAALLAARGTPVRATEPVVPPTCVLLLDRSAAGSEPRFAFALAELRLGDALRYLLKGSDLQLVSEDSLHQTPVVALDSVTVGSALDALVRGSNLTWSIEGSHFRVSRLESRNYPVNQVALAESPFWTELEKNLPSLVSEGGKFAVNTRAGIVSVIDAPEVQERVRLFLRDLERDLDRQVRLEAQIVETDLDQDDAAGIDWAAFARGWNGYTGNTQAGAIFEQLTTTGDGAFQIGLVRAGRLKLLVDLLEARGRLHVLSRPQVVAMGNEKALFRSTENVPYYQLQTFANEGSTPYTQYEVHFEHAGVTLEVQAHVGTDDRITLEVHPVVSSISGFTDALPGLPPQPIIDERETQTVVRLREGETLVIGGLIQERERRQTRGVPLVSRLPWLGGLFKSTRVFQARQELTVLLTPSVLRDAPVERFRRSSRTLLLERTWPNEGARTSLSALLHDRAVGAWQSGEFATAIEASRRALMADPSITLERLNLGVYLAEAGFFSDARAEWELLAKYAEHRPYAEANLAALDLVEGQFTEEPAPRARRVSVDEPDALAAQAVNEASRLEQVGQSAAAADLLREVAQQLDSGSGRRLLEDCLEALTERPTKD